ncbi:MAG: type II toxin-antitoxin system VapC family toxin [Kutzneria sp.]|nr:type II toxin-antitoxin system VapC family toxin [Kutzneria sp.]MBV9845910.1 type II toxin-antitoxin system VapC family toxin [Kutzneria sp.]
MIILDTNVLSELVRDVPNPQVMAWLDSLPADDIATTAIAIAELLYGVIRLPDGRRKTLLAEAVQTMIDDDFRGRVAPFDTAAAACYAVVVADRERLGRPISVADAQIAAICNTRRATLATRNTKDFVDTGIELLDPWRCA